MIQQPLTEKTFIGNGETDVARQDIAECDAMCRLGGDCVRAAALSPLTAASYLNSWLVAN